MIKRNVEGSLIQINNTTESTRAYLTDRFIEDVLIYVSSSGARLSVVADEIKLNFTPDDLNNIPLNVTDFSEPIPLVPLLVVYNSTDDVYIVLIRINSYVHKLSLEIKSDGGSMKRSYQISYIEGGMTDGARKESF